MRKLFFLIYLNFFMVFCATNNVVAQDANTVLATVEDTNITLGHVIALQDRLTDQYKSLEDAVLFKGILDQLIQQAVLAKAIENQKNSRVQYSYENELRAFLANTYISMISKDALSEKDIKDFYEVKYNSSQSGKEFNAAHILLKTESKAISNPIETQFGWHIIKLNNSRLKTPPSLEDVRAEIERALKDKYISEEVRKITSAAKVVRTKVSVDPSIVRNISLLSK
jgi:peptidyl-prolyl cis-trans isomerase C